MKKFALILLLVACAHAPVQTSALPELAAEKPVLLASADVGTSVRDWYVAKLLQQPTDPFAPVFNFLTVIGSGSSTFVGPITAKSFTATAAANTFGLNLTVSGAKVATGLQTYWTESGTTGSYVSNGATVASFDRTNGATLYTPGVNTTYFPAGTLFSSSTAVQNGGSCAAGVDLIAYSLPASALNVTNRCLRVTIWGTTANNATAKNIDLALGATPTVLVTKALTVSLVGTWNVSAVICRTGASTQTSWALAENNQGTGVIGTGADSATVTRNTNFSTPNFTETSAQSIRARCITNVNAAGDIIAKGMTVEIM